jgi:hypothetical protein
LKRSLYIIRAAPPRPCEKHDVTRIAQTKIKI